MALNSEPISLEEWRKLTLSDDPLVRCDAAENFPEMDDGTQVAAILILMLDDEDELVRTEVAESLAFFEAETVREALWRRFNVETSDLVKGYLLCSISEVGDMQDWSSLLTISESSQNVLIQSNALAGLQRLVSRHTTGKLRALVKAFPEEAGPPITNLIAYLHVFWLQKDVARFVANTEPLLNQKDRGWMETLAELKNYVNQQRN